MQLLLLLLLFKCNQSFSFFLVEAIQYSYHQISRQLPIISPIFLQVEIFTVQFLSKEILEVNLTLPKLQYLVFSLWSLQPTRVSVHFLELLPEHFLSSRELLTVLTLNVFIAKSSFFLYIHHLQLLFLVIQMFTPSSLLLFEFFALSNQKCLSLMFEPFVICFV